ncbi:hypothetical protein [Bradyrhizobium sp. OAE829]|uniref:hypothetical protein n=1 Tax=Bradyrhizobium sp. OAE829 TaxID=2663807 RepID=UPI001A0C026F
MASTSYLVLQVARPAPACNEQGIMCNKCDDIRKIAHYKQLASLITDQQTLNGIGDLIKKMVVEKTTFRCEQPPEK